MQSCHFSFKYIVQNVFIDIYLLDFSGAVRSQVKMSRRRGALTDKELKLEILDLKHAHRGHITLRDPGVDEVLEEQKKEIGQGGFWFRRCILGLPQEFMNRAVVNKPEVCINILNF